MQSACTILMVLSLFQSTPAIAGGRMMPAGSGLSGGARFQSTPAIAGGRMEHVHRLAVIALNVSIHARHCWRANGCYPVAGSG